MHQQSRPWLWSLLAVTYLTAAACGGSPSSPSDLSGSGATITGRVNGGNALTSPSWSTASSSQAAAATLTVSVVGTNITTTVDGNGQFTLTNVPAGTVRIQFTGPGTNATITLSGLNSGEHIDITVTLRGNNASVDSQSVEAEGKVSNLTGKCPLLTFVVRNRTVHTNGSTSFKDGPCSAIQNNTEVDVKGQRQSDGSIMATKVEIDEDDED